MRKSSVLVLGLWGVVACGADPGEEELADQANGLWRPSRRACDADNGGITLPPGFCAAVAADQIGKARHVVVSLFGDVYVAIADETGPGGVAALRDRDRDGHADVITYFGDPGANGVAFHDGRLYVAYKDRIVRWRMRGADLVPRGAPEVIVGGLPFDGDHFAKNITFDLHGHMFVNIGSPSNACQVENRVLHSPGKDPCPELATRAGIWRFDADRPNQTQADGVHWGIGFRNTEALRYNVVRGALFGIQHGRDMLNDNWPELFTVEQGAELPSEEMVKIDRGDDNGWPYCYHDWQKDQKVLAPEYGGDGNIVSSRCADKEEPLLAFPGHWAPNDLLFYRHFAFPLRYSFGAFIAFHGGHDRAPLPNEGFNVVFAPFDLRGPTGRWEVFADNFTMGASPLPQAAPHRPMGLAKAPDGALYITDDVGGRVWRVIYTGR